jgi:ABC-type transport system involved in cytochrome bd biosynthesis fused ATPase/permease subunit
MAGFVSCRRIEKYLLQEEVDVDTKYQGTGDISLSNVTFTWPREQEDLGPNGSSAPPSSVHAPQSSFTLTGLDLVFPQGKLSLICGRLGSGKTLLLAGLLGEADVLTGRVDCPRSSPNAMAQSDKEIRDEDWIIPTMLAYVPQQAWLQNASIKDNIVFSSPWNETRYQAVLDACSLNSDLLILEDGDET